MDNLSDNNISFESESTVKKYKSRNFSVGFISLIVGIIFMAGGGIVFYFTRPCVLGECLLIPQSQESIDSSLARVEEGMSREELTQVQLNLIAVNLRLGNIPSWSSHYNQAQTLILENRTNIDDLEDLLQSLQGAENAENMMTKLPLSVEEWERVRVFWQEAIALIESVQNPMLEPWINNQLTYYNNNLTVVEDSIEQEQIGDQLLLEAQQIAQENQTLNDNLSSLEELKAMEANWQKAIANIRQIPLMTRAETEKESLLEQYNQSLTDTRTLIRREEIANNLYGQVQNNIIQAENAENNNQWTNAVNHWQEIINLIEQIPADSLLNQQVINIQQKAEEKLPLAQEELELAVNRQNAQEELANICQGSGKICDYVVEKNRIKVILTSDYLRNIARITQQSVNGSSDETSVLINHIEQVEQNYRYLSVKYGMPLEVYNPQQKLIMRYH
ncbi:hypothetical protein Cyast_2396 [Cyanobacterium stanieri PCC 7202]|uniref:Uncharacterized protein n=1 Tax=Cyanobacterium stanieri (strain ATCC 29140 / PCC 7202) TaxID=292563 RepID=K9YPF5_CYASC|nr:hypothetical protein Cyast_2396 [Cyanobacterium stanieri PCC 7202]